MRGLWADTEQPSKVQSVGWGPWHPQKESPASGSLTLALLAPLASLRLSLPWACPRLSLSASWMFCEREPHVGTLQGDPVPGLQVGVPLNRVTRGAKEASGASWVSGCCRSALKSGAGAAGGRLRAWRGPWMGSQATYTATLEAGAAVGSESWLCSHPTSHPRHSLMWPLTIGHFPTR